MQSAKSLNHYRFRQYDVSLTILNEQKVSLSVCDSHMRMEFGQKEITLREIKSSTLMRALEQDKIEVKMDMNTKKSSEATVLQIQILVSSQFLKPVEETIFLSKRRDISESEIIRNSVDQLSQKLKNARNQEKGPACLCSVPSIDEKLYNTSNNYQQIGSIKLPRGKYLVTFSFFAKASGSLMYLYLNNGQATLIQNCCIYTPNTGFFLPFTFRKVHQINKEEDVVILQTYCSQSYPSNVRNMIISAKKIQ